MQEQLDASKRQPKTIVTNTRAESNNSNRNNGGSSKRKSSRNNNFQGSRVNNAKAVVSSQFSNFPNFEKTLQPSTNANQQQQPKKQVLTKIPVRQFIESNSGNRNQVL